MEQWTYQKAGVDVQAGYEAVRLMKGHAAKTWHYNTASTAGSGGVLGGLGGFGGLFALPTGYTEPVLVSGTDGVGTKLKIAFMAGVHNTVGIDCVAMSVNDIACQGAKPLFFLDYIGIGVLNPPVAAALVAGVSEGCLQAGCALIGGETAEMPDIYAPGEYDLAGFAVGIAEKSKIISGQRVQAGDALIGVASSGLHSNGYSLVRKLCFDVQQLRLDQYIAPLNAPLGEILLTPTKIYVPLLAELMPSFDIRGIAHITGGGWIENIPRLLGENTALKTVVRQSAVPVPPIFQLLAKWGQVSTPHMYGTFNMGIGLVLAVPAEQADAVQSAISAMGEQAWFIGETATREAGEEAIQFV